MGIYNPSGATAVFNTLAAMRAAGIPPNRTPNGLLLNRATPFDGGGGSFTWMTGLAVAIADDDCTVIVPVGAPIGSAWVRRFFGPVSILWAGGAPGTNSTNALINADKAATNTPIYNAGGLVCQPNHEILLPTLYLNAPEYEFGGNGVVINITSNLRGSGNFPDVGHLDVYLFNGTTFTCGSLTNIDLFFNTGCIVSTQSLTNSVIQCGADATSFHCTSPIRNCNLTFSGVNQFTLESGGYNFGAWLHIEDSYISLTGGIGFYSAPNSPLKIERSTLVGDGGLVDGQGTSGDALSVLVLKDCNLQPAGPANAAGVFTGFNTILVEDSPTTSVNTLSAVDPIFAALTLFQGRNSPVPAGQLMATATELSPDSGEVALVSGTIYQNLATFPIFINQSVTYNPTATAAATMTPAVGLISPPAALPAESVPAASLVGNTRSYFLMVPPGWFYSFTAVNAVLNNAVVGK